MIKQKIYIIAPLLIIILISAMIGVLFGLSGIHKLGLPLIGLSIISFISLAGYMGCTSPKNC